MAKVQYWFVHVWLYIYVCVWYFEDFIIICSSIMCEFHVTVGLKTYPWFRHEILWLRLWNPLSQAMKWTTSVMSVDYSAAILRSKDHLPLTWMLIVFLTTWSLFIVFTFLYTASCCLFYTSLLLSLSVCGIAFEIRKSNVRFLQLFQKVTLPTLILYY